MTIVGIIITSKTPANVGNDKTDVIVKANTPKEPAMPKITKVVALARLLVITAVTSMYAASALPGICDCEYKLIDPELNNWGLVHIIISGALASAGSSALNHYYDKDIDPLMKRTSTRPIPSGRMSAKSVFAYGLAVSSASVIYAAITLNLVSTFFIALGIFFYVIVYTV